MAFQVSAPIQHAARKRREPTGMNRTIGTREGTTPRGHGTALPLGLRQVYPQVRLPNVQPGDRAPDQHPLNFARALKNREDPSGTGSLRRSAAYGPRGTSARREGTRTLPGLPLAAYSAAAHPRYILPLTCNYLAVHDTGPRVRGPDGPHAGQTSRGMRNPGLAVAAPTRRHRGPDGPHDADDDKPALPRNARRGTL